MLGISRHTVDQRLQFSKERLGATSRFEAARIFARYEANTCETSIPDQMIYKPLHMETRHQDSTLIVPAGAGDDHAGAVTSSASDKYASYGDPLLLGTSESLFPSVSKGGRHAKRLTVVGKLFWVLAIAAVSLLMFSAAVAALEMLSRLQ